MAAAVLKQARATGAAMDRPVPKRRPNTVAWAAGGTLLLLGGALTLSWLVPHGLRIAMSDIRVATVEQGLFHNEVMVRSTAEPLHTVMLDALDSGRVEEVAVPDGALVEQGTLLFRLSNPQLRLNLVARDADRAQQISNLSVLRVSIEASETEHQRRLLDLRFTLAQAQRQYRRNASLAKDGIVSITAFEDSRDRLEQQTRALDDEQTRDAIERRIKREGVRQMEQAVEQLDAGLKVVSEAIDALAVRAPIAGRLTDFRLQLGEIVKAEQRIGRIDDPSQFKLTAQIDEYFLGGVTGGKRGSVTVSGHDYAVEVSRVFPQIREGRFSAELHFINAASPNLHPGQSVDTRIVMGGSSPALVLPNDAFLVDTGGSWVMVVAHDGRTAERRKISVGRRSNSQVEVTAGLSPGERVIVSTYAGFGKADRLNITG